MASNILPPVEELVTKAKKRKTLFTGLSGSLEVLHSTSFQDISSKMLGKLTEKEVQCWLVVKHGIIAIHKFCDVLKNLPPGNYSLGFNN